MIRPAPVHAPRRSPSFPPTDTRTTGAASSRAQVPTTGPLVLRFDRETGSIFVISFNDPACAQARIGRPVREDRPYNFEGRYGRAGAAMVVRPDGRPLIAYRDVIDGRSSCSTAAPTMLAGRHGHGAEPGRNAGPAMVLDQDGRALVAYQDLDRERIVIAACAGRAATHTPVHDDPARR